MKKKRIYKKINKSDDPILIINNLRKKKKSPSGMHSPSGNAWGKYASGIFPGFLEVPGAANVNADTQFANPDDFFYFFGGEADPFQQEQDEEFECEEKDSVDESIYDLYNHLLNTNKEAAEKVLKLKKSI